jgi:hypothetical protein
MQMHNITDNAGIYVRIHLFLLSGRIINVFINVRIRNMVMLIIIELVWLAVRGRLEEFRPMGKIRRGCVCRLVRILLLGLLSLLFRFVSMCAKREQLGLLGILTLIFVCKNVLFLTMETRQEIEHA